MEQTNTSPKKGLKRPKKGKDNANKPKKRTTAYQMIVRHLQKSDPVREKRERELRRKSIEHDILMIEGVDQLLCCSVQRVRKIPHDELPRREGPGKSDLFLKEDVIAYVRAHSKRHAVADDLMREIEIEELESDSDSGSRRRGKRRNRDV